MSPSLNKDDLEDEAEWENHGSFPFPTFCKLLKKKLIIYLHTF